MKLDTRTQRRLRILLGALLIAAMLSACSGSQDTVPGDEDGSWEEYAAWCSRAFLEEPPGDEDPTYGEASTFYAGVIESMKSASPPAEVADWHNKYLDVFEGLKALIDAEAKDELFNPIDIFFDSEVISLFEEVEEEFNALPADARERLAAAGCLGDDSSELTDDEVGTGAGTVKVDDETCDRLLDNLTVSGVAGAVSPEAVRYECTAAGSWSAGSSTVDDVLVTLVDQPVRFELSGEAAPADVKARLYPRLDGNDLFRLSGVEEGDEWHAELELDHLESVDLGAVREASHAFTSGLGDYTLVVRASWRGDVEATVFYATHIRMDLEPVSNLRYAWDWDALSIQVTWDAVAGAERYNVYLGASGCEVGDGWGRQCEELASNVVGTNYVHDDAGRVWNPNNHYWVVACSGTGCSGFDAENPALPVEERPDAPPADVRFAIEGASIRVVWEAVEGADSYNVYYERRLLATAVVGTDFVHTEPEYGDYEYWVSACNRGGCSDVDVENPAKPFEDRPSSPTNLRTVVEGSSIRVSWDAVEGADYFKVYHRGTPFDSHSGCQLSGSGAVFGCDELSADVREVTYVHARPDVDHRHFYWVVACNKGGCSDIDEENPAVVGDSSPSRTERTASPSPAQSATQAGSDTSRRSFEASTPSDYTEVALTDRGTVWGTPQRFTTDSSLGAVAYMLLGSVRGCSFASEELSRSSSVYLQWEELGRLPTYESDEVCGRTSRTWDTGWTGLRITHLRIFDESSPTNFREYVYDPDSGQYVE